MSTRRHVGYREDTGNKVVFIPCSYHYGVSEPATSAMKIIVFCSGTFCCVSVDCTVVFYEFVLGFRIDK
jgi:hypothetical protein